MNGGEVMNGEGVMNGGEVMYGGGAMNQVSDSDPQEVFTERSTSKHVQKKLSERALSIATKLAIRSAEYQGRMAHFMIDERGDVPGWVLVVLMTTGLVTGIWTIAAPRIESLLRGSLDAMNNVH